MTAGDESRSEFEKAMSNTRPLEGRDKVAARPKTLRRRKRRDDEGGGEGFEIDRLGERHEGLAPGVDRKMLLKLRNGEFKPDERLDLHGMDTVTARRRVHEATRRAQQAGLRCLLVIHGRGNHSEGEPLLKESLIDWLADPAVFSLVQAFSSATGGHGGVGATYVLLRD
jgi:DNA-nicking Smr family endonuclease